MTRESITIKKTPKGTWMKKFDDYDKSFTKVSKREALEDIDSARNRGDIYSDDVVTEGSWSMWGYFN